MHPSALIRTLNGSHLTNIANDPSVRPVLGGEGFVDLVPVVADPNNITLATEDGGFIYFPLYEGAYEVHTIFEANVSPRRVLACAAQSLEYMFVRTLAQAQPDQPRAVERGERRPRQQGTMQNEIKSIN